MKNLFKIIFLFGLISFASWGNDDDCTADSFVGSFDGTIECPGNDPASWTLVITKISDTSIKVTDQDATEFTMEVAGCIATSLIDFFGVSVTQTLTLDGDMIDYKAVNSGLGMTVTCTGSMTRQ